MHQLLLLLENCCVLIHFKRTFQQGMTFYADVTFISSWTQFNNLTVFAEKKGRLRNLPFHYRSPDPEVAWSIIIRWLFREIFRDIEYDAVVIGVVLIRGESIGLATRWKVVNTKSHALAHTHRSVMTGPLPVLSGSLTPPGVLSEVDQLFPCPPLGKL